MTSLPAEEWDAQALYETSYCMRGEMESRIEEQMSLFADRLSAETIRGNQLRGYFAGAAYVLILNPAVSDLEIDLSSSCVDS